MAEDFDDHRRIFDGGDDLQSAAAGRAVFDVDVEDPFESRAQIMRRRALPERERFCCAPSHWALKRMEANQM